MYLAMTCYYFIRILKISLWRILFYIIYQRPGREVYGKVIC